MSGQDESNRAAMAQLRWRCRRGMKELDLLLLKYADGRYSAADEAERRAFRQLLSMPDPEIMALLTGRSTTDDERLADVVERLLSQT